MVPTYNSCVLPGGARDLDIQHTGVSIKCWWTFECEIIRFALNANVYLLCLVVAKKKTLQCFNLKSLFPYSAYFNSVSDNYCDRRVRIVDASPARCKIFFIHSVHQQRLDNCFNRRVRVAERFGNPLIRDEAVYHVQAEF